MLGKLHSFYAKVPSFSIEDVERHVEVEVNVVAVYVFFPKTAATSVFFSHSTAVSIIYTSFIMVP